QGQPGTGPSDRFPGGNVLVDRTLDRSSLPPANVIRLIAARDEDHFRLPYYLCDRRFFSRFAIRNNQRRHGVRLAQSVYIRVVIVIAGRAQNQKIASAALITQ